MVEWVSFGAGFVACFFLVVFLVALVPTRREKAAAAQTNRREAREVELIKMNQYILDSHEQRNRILERICDALHETR